MEQSFYNRPFSCVWTCGAPPWPLRPEPEVLTSWHPREHAQQRSGQRPASPASALPEFRVS